MSTLPDFTGTGFFAGEAPDGLTTIAGTPTSASVRVYWRDPADPQAPDALVASTQSAADGTWQITGLNPALRYVVRAQKSQFDDVTVVGAVPSRSDVIAYVDHLEPTEDFDGLTGYVLLDSGLQPFTCEVIQPLPYGLSARVDGRKLLIEGVSTDNGLWESVVRVTASNGVFADVPVVVEIAEPSDPHWDKVLSLLNFQGSFDDDKGGTWNRNSTTAVVLTDQGASFSGGTAWVRRTGLAVMDSEDFTLEGFCLPTQTALSTVALGMTVTGSRISYEVRLSSTRLRFFYTRNNSTEYMPVDYTLPSALSDVTHWAICREGAELRAYLDGVLVATGTITGALAGTPAYTYIGNRQGADSYGSFKGIVSSLRITKGVARYSSNFTPPDKPFPNQ